MTSVERIGNILRRKPVDRIGVFEHFWGDTHKKWTAEGHIAEGESLEDHFGFDFHLCWPFNMVADLDYQPETIEETEETILQRDGIEVKRAAVLSMILRAHLPQVCQKYGVPCPVSLPPPPLPPRKK